MRSVLAALSVMVALASPAIAQNAPPAARQQKLDPKTAVYELRIYSPNPGKFAAVNARFRDHTLKFFTKHGMRNVAYWNEQPSATAPEGRVIYILAYPSLAAREASWAAFRADPGWKAVVAASEANGKLVAKVDSSFMNLTDYSPALTLPR
jgi:hypothetical protein